MIPLLASVVAGNAFDALDYLLGVTRPSATNVILLAQVASTWGLVGLIWMVQVVHYPLFLAVGPEHFVEYERAHTNRISFIVGPLMAVESVSAIALLFKRPENVKFAVVLAGIGLLGVIHSSTVLLQVPAHTGLSESFDLPTVIRLVRTNWIRTIGWSLRGALTLFMLYQQIR